MKRLYKILMMMALPLAVGSCDVEYDPIVIYPDVTLENSGLTNVQTISIYQNDAYAVTLTRTEGLSRAAEFDIVLDQGILDEYNELNGASYTMMPTSGYTIGVSEIVFPEKSKTASFTVQFKPEELIRTAGSIEAAQNYAIPIVCIPRTTVNSSEQYLNTIVRITFDTPKVTVEAPMAPQALTFISGVPVSRKLELTGTSNFTTLDISGLTFAATQEMVDEYNAAQQTDYELLPASAYSIDQGTFDSEALSFLFNITVDASTLDPDFVYLLPLKVLSNEYTVVQDAIYYVKVSVQEIQVTLENTDRYEAATTLTHTIELDLGLNGALDADFPVEFIYDPSLIATYNQEKGKEYKTFDASRISVENTTMEAGRMKATATVSVDMTDIGFDTGDEYVLPFALDKSKLPQGYIMQTDDVVYVRLKRTFYGTWSNRTNDNYVTGTSGWTKNNYMRATTLVSDTKVNGQAYPYKNCYYSWSTGYHWYVGEELYNGDAKKRVVHVFSKVTSGYTESQQVSQTMNNNSYFYMETGTVYFDFQYYWNDDDKAKDNKQTIHCYLQSPLTPDEF